MKSAPPWPAAGTLLLVNREHPLLRAPESEELTAVDRRHPDILLHRRAKVMLDELLQAGKEGRLKEAFGSGTAAVISPIGELKIDEHVLQLSDGKIGPISQKLYDQLTGIQWGRVPGPEGWSVKVCD